MEQGGEEATRLFRVRRTIWQMLRDRGYLVGQKDLNTTLEEFRATFGDHPDRALLSIQTSLLSNEEEQVLVYFPSEAKVTFPTLQRVVQLMRQHSISLAILVAAEPLSGHTARAVQEGLVEGFRFEFFLEKELLVNITEHDLVPKHTPMTEEEKEALLERYKVKESQLPRIRKDDPVARYLGLRRGQVVRIVRKSETAGRYVTYRICL